jgi:hypothetical protein
MASTSNHGQIQGRIIAQGKSDISRVNVFRRAVFVAVLSSLIGTPSFLWMTAFFGDSALRRALATMTTFWFPLWAVFAVWVAFKASTLYGLLGPRPNPLAPRTLKLSALGVAKCRRHVRLPVFLILTRQ